MDTPNDFPLHDHFDKLANIDLRALGEHSQGGVEVGAHLEAHVFAFKAHVLSVQDWAEESVTALLMRLHRLVAAGVLL